MEESSFGSTSAAGPLGGGTVFSMNTNGDDYTVLHAFSAVTGLLKTNAEGAEIASALSLSGGSLELHRPAAFICMAVSFALVAELSFG